MHSSRSMTGKTENLPKHFFTRIYEKLKLIFIIFFKVNFLNNFLSPSTMGSGGGVWRGHIVFGVDPFGVCVSISVASPLHFIS